MEIKGHPPRFLDILKDSFEEDDRIRGAETKLREIRHNPSSASIRRPDGTVVGACLRSLFYKAKAFAVTNPKELTTKLQGDFGNAIHKTLQDRLQKHKSIKLVPESAGKVSVDGLTKEVSFRLDGLVSYHGEMGCLEIKTVNSFALTRMLKTVGGPKEKDILQVLSYFGTNPDLMWAAIIYFGRDTAFRSEHHIVKQSDGSFTIRNVVPEGKEKKIEGLSYEEIVKRWKELEDYLEKDEVPPRDYKVVLDKEGKVTEKRTKNHVDYKSDQECLYCSYQDLCWSGPDAAKDAYRISGE
jgi:hypothetical protein